MALSENRYRAVSFLGIALGVWLFISAFIWVHTASQYYNAWIVGAVATLLAAAAARQPQLRWGNVVLGIWLFLSVWILPTIASATWWNHLLVGAALFVVSLVPGHVGEPVRRGTLRD